MKRQLWPPRSWSTTPCCASSREQYRRLAAALHHAQEATGVKVVMIASAVAGEGKTLTAANLALTFSESYQRVVLLIDGDLRRPSLHRMFKIDVESGLTDALGVGRTSRSWPSIELSDRLTILPAGRPNSDPMAGLTSVAHAATHRGGARGLRLGDHRHAAGRPAVGREPAVGDGRCRRARHPRRAARRTTSSSARSRRSAPIAILGHRAQPGDRRHCTRYAYDYYRYYQAPHAQSAQGG